MKVSQLIEDLQRVLENDGDLKIGVEDTDGVAFYSIELYVDRNKTLRICEKEYTGN